MSVAEVMERGEGTSASQGDLEIVMDGVKPPFAGRGHKAKIVSILMPYLIMNWEGFICGAVRMQRLFPCMLDCAERLVAMISQVIWNADRKSFYTAMCQSDAVAWPCSFTATHSLYGFQMLGDYDLNEHLYSSPISCISLSLGRLEPRGRDACCCSPVTRSRKVERCLSRIAPMRKHLMTVYRVLS